MSVSSSTDSSSPSLRHALELDREYWCFISYRHADNKLPGRQWATWLHQSLESYEIPEDLVGATNDRGHVIPDRIFPVFRDEEELPADAELSQAIDKALQRSRFLVVLCSPQAVASRFVNEEIIRFKQLRKDDCLLAVIIEGEPNVSGSLSADSSQRECFPLPLRFKVDGQGNLTDRLAEPIAADFRLPDGSPGWTGPTAYREALEAQKLPPKVVKDCVRAYSEHSRMMFLKIVAGILGVPLRTLTQREQAYQLKKQKEKARSLRRWLFVVAILATVALIAALYANDRRVIADNATSTALALADRNLALAEQKQVALQRVETEYTRAETQRSLAEARRQNLERFTYLSMQLAIQRGGALWLARALELARPEDAEFAEAIRYALTAESVYKGLSLGMVRHPKPVRSVAWSSDGRELTTVCDDRQIRVWDMLEPGNVKSSTAFEGWPFAVAVSSKKILAVGRANQGAELLSSGGQNEISAQLPHKAFVELQGFDPLEKMLLSAGWDHKVRIWNTDDGLPVSQELEHQADVSCFCFSPDGKLLLTGCWDGMVRLWNLSESKLVGEPVQHRQAVSSVAFHPNGEFCISAGLEGEVYVQNTADGSTAGRPRSFDRTIAGAEFRRDGKLLALTARNEEILLVRFDQDLPVERRLVAQSPCSALTFSPDGKLLVSGTEDGIIQFWHVNTGVLVATASIDESPGEATSFFSEVSKLVFSADGSRVASIQDSNVALWMTPAVADGEVSEIVTAVQTNAGGVLSSEGTFRAFTENERPTTDPNAESPFQRFKATIDACFLGTLSAASASLGEKTENKVLSVTDNRLLKEPSIRRILSDHTVAMRDLANLSRELIAKEAMAVSGPEAAAVEFDAAIAEACLVFLDGDPQKTEVAFEVAVSRGQTLQSILKDTTDLGLMDVDAYQRAVLTTMLVRRTQLHARHWHEGAENPENGVSPHPSQFQQLVRNLFPNNTVTVTPDELRLMRELTEVRKRLYQAALLREEVGARRGTQHEVNASRFLWDVERARTAAAQHQQSVSLVLLDEVTELGKKMSHSLREVQPFDMRPGGGLPQQDQRRLFADNLRWMMIATTNSQLIAESLRITQHSHDFAGDILAPHIFLCDWIICHNYAEASIAASIATQESAILADAEQKLKSILNTVRLIRGARNGTYSNIEVYQHLVPLVWLDAQRQFSLGNPQASLQTLITGAELAGQQRKAIQTRVDAGVTSPIDSEYIQSQAQQIQLRLAVVRLQNSLNPVNGSSSF